MSLYQSSIVFACLLFCVSADCIRSYNGCNVGAEDHEVGETWDYWDSWTSCNRGCTCYASGSKQTAVTCREVRKVAWSDYWGISPSAPEEVEISAQDATTKTCNSTPDVKTIIQNHETGESTYIMTKDVQYYYYGGKQSECCCGSVVAKDATSWVG